MDTSREMNSRLSRKEYSYAWDKDKSRHAVITFVNTAEGWKLSGCSYTCLNDIYDQDDWDFLHDLSAEIKRLCELEDV